MWRKSEERDVPEPTDERDDGDWAYDQWKDKQLDERLEENHEQ